MDFYVGIWQVPHIDLVPHFFMLSFNSIKNRVSSIICDCKEWILDSSGFTQLHRFGKYTFTIDEYARCINYHRPDIAVVMDWMCEPSCLNKTKLTIKEHQKRTIKNHILLKDVVDKKIPLMGVIQGWSIKDYLDHIDMISDIGLYEDTMGIGTVCIRQNTNWIIKALSAIRDAVPNKIKLHAFGIKRGALKHKKVIECLDSCDSMSWSFEGRWIKFAEYNSYCKETNTICRTTRNCANCGYYMRYWADGIEQLINKTILN